MITRIQTNDLALWLRELSALMRAGKTPLDALRATGADASQPGSIRTLTKHTAGLMERGSPFTDALQASVGNAAPKATLYLLQASLSSGLPPEDSLRLAISLLSGPSRAEADSWTAWMRFTVTTVVVLTLASCLLFLLVPALTAAALGPELTDWNSATPLATQALLGLAKVTGSVPFAVVLLVIGATWLALTLGRLHLGRTERGTLFLDRLALDIPVLNRWVLQAATARLFRVLGTLLDNQVPLPQALQTARLAMGNRELANAMQPVQQALNLGQSLSLALSEASPLPPAVCRMVAEGEISGALSATLHKLADVYDAEARGTSRRLRAAASRCAVVGLLVLVLFILLGLLLPQLGLIRMLGVG